MKFRIWGLKENKFITYPNDDSRLLIYSEYGDMGVLYGFGDEYEPSDILDEDNYKIMFSTGLFDKNGKEIYEGDILIYRYYLDPHTDGMQYLEVKNYTDFLIELGPLPRFHSVAIKLLSNSMEVIGNKYENPDLLDLLEGDENEI